jgi:hypothetical protein
MRTVRYFVIFFMVIAAGAVARECIPFVTVQQLLQNAQNYHRQIIVVDGWTRRGLEYFTIQATKEPFQREQIWLDNIDFIKATEARWPEDKKYRATSEPVLDLEAQRKYRKLFSLKRPTHVILKGEFQTSRESEFGDGSFRHRLILYEVISIEK